MSKVRLSDIAAEAAKQSKDILEACKELGIEAKNANASISEEDAGKVFEYVVNGTKPAAPKKKASAEPKPKAEEKSLADKIVRKPREKRVSTKTAKEEPAKTTETLKVEEKKEEPVKTAEPEVKKEEEAIPVAPPIQRARRKLTIVKKKNPKKVDEAPKKDSKPITVSDENVDLSELGYGRKKVVETDEEIAEAKKKKSKAKAGSTTKKEHGVKLDVFGDISMEKEEKEEHIFMPDLSMGNLTNSLDQSRPTKSARQEPQQQQRPVGRGGGGNKGKRRSIERQKKTKVTKEKVVEGDITSVVIPEEVRVYEFADALRKNAGEIIKVLFGLGMMVTKNDFLDKDALEILAEEFGVEIKFKDVMEELDYAATYDEKYTDLNEERPPIVTIMGHVDHGKTSLLDYIRKAKVADGEAGGITQHIGAYTITKDGKKITFIDTPGHAAFSEMRARGANATDVVIIVVAADDGVMPQTKEAINHAKASGAPIIVAINKMDKPGAQPDVVKGQLAEIGITPTDWGGDYDAIGVSAHTGDGVEELLENIIIQSELLELKANSKDPAKAVVIESSVEKGRGAVATVIVQNGSLNVGDIVLAGTTFGRVRAIMNEQGKQVKVLGPSEAGEVLGLSGSPMSGEILVRVENEKFARELSEKRAEHERQKELSKSTKATLDDLHSLIAEGKLKSLRIILKADVQGTLEAIASNLGKLRNDEVKVEIIHSAVGTISESDISLASASEHTIILGFHVKPTASIKEKAKKEGVEIKTYNVIYDMIDDVKKTLGGMLSPITKEEKSGTAEVREVYDISSLGRIAGCMVTSGDMVRGAIAVVYRGEKEIYRGRLESLKRFKDDVKEVKKGYECGIGLQDFDETEPGDIIECIKEVEVEAEFKNEG
ncbi:MAG: translation initiation factor IF-2 [Campylobacterales bacterium]|nr:translation initiation factor IF-2 [Campylobacterales bacterium]